MTVIRKLALIALLYAPWITWAAQWQTSSASSPSVHWQAEFGLGAAYNAKTPLEIDQAGFPDLSFTARYETRPFQMPPHYILRFSRWDHNQAWSVEELHHKIYLNNNPAEVDAFSISHGYNMITVQHAWRFAHDVIYRLGGGVVLAHPENKIRGRRIDSESGGWFDGGYYLAGPAGQVAIAKQFPLGAKRRWLLNFEAKATAAKARVKVVGGHAVVPNIALHAVVSLVWNIF